MQTIMSHSTQSIIEKAMTPKIDRHYASVFPSDTPAAVIMARALALNELRRDAPAWSPFADAKELPGSLSIIFPALYFAELVISGVSPTQMRRLRNHITKARPRGLTPEWLPEVDFTPNDIPHLYALAVTIGAHALLDLNEMIAADPKLQDKIGNSILDLRDTYRPFSKRRMGYALDGACGFLGTPDFSQFIISLADPDAMATPFGQAMFDFIVEGVGEEAIKADARRLSKSDRDYVARAARAFLHIPEPQAAPDDAASAILIPDSSATDPTSDQALREEQKTAPAPKWIAPTAPEGVILTQRALRELRAERNWPAEKLEAALAALGAYRAMKLGEITLAAYNEQLAANRLADTLCFADPGTLKAFAADYSVSHNGKRVTLDRHIKWGRGRNATTGLRVYYAWDPQRAEVIVGSMPRHLPNKRT